MFENKIPYLRGKLSQKEMKEDAMKSIRKRKKGKYKLTYDKATKTIIAVPTEKDKLAKEELLDELGKVFAGGVYTQLYEIVEKHFEFIALKKAYGQDRSLDKKEQQKPTVTMKEIENAVGDTSDEYTEGVVELFESKGFEIGK